MEKMREDSFDERDCHWWFEQIKKAVEKRPNQKAVENSITILLQMIEKQALFRQVEGVDFPYVLPVVDEEDLASWLRESHLGVSRYLVGVDLSKMNWVCIQPQDLFLSLKVFSILQKKGVPVFSVLTPDWEMKLFFKLCQPDFILTTYFTPVMGGFPVLFHTGYTPFFGKGYRIFTAPRNLAPLPWWLFFAIDYPNGNLFLYASKNYTISKEECRLVLFAWGLRATIALMKTPLYSEEPEFLTALLQFINSYFVQEPLKEHEIAKILDGIESLSNYTLEEIKGRL